MFVSKYRIMLLTENKISNHPREKLISTGSGSLSDTELLAILLWSGIRGKGVLSLAEQVVKKFFDRLHEVTLQELTTIKWIWEAKALQILSVIEMAKRLSGLNKKPSLRQSVASVRKSNINLLANKVHPWDCLDVMKRIPDKSIDMILCDLPYWTTQNKWDSVIPLDLLWNEYERIIKDNGAIVLTSQWLFTAKLILSNERLFKYKIVWEKSKPTNFLNSKKQPLRKHEDICVFYKSQPTYNPQMSAGEAYNKGIRKNQLTGSYGDFSPVEVKSDWGRYPVDVVYFKTAESEWPVYHPTQKPVDLGRYLIRTFSNPGDIVLDNTCGSWSFLVAAVMEGRKFIGIEKNEEVHLFKKDHVDYVRICRNRLKEASQ